MSPSSWLSLGGGLAMVLGIMVLLARLVRKLRPDLLSRDPSGPPLTVLSRASLTPRQGVAVVRYRDRDLVVSYGEGGVHLLHGEDEGAGSVTGRQEKREEKEEVGEAVRVQGRETALTFPGERTGARLPDVPGGSFSPGWWNRLRKTVMMGGLGLLLMAAAGAPLPLGAEPHPRDGTPEVRAGEGSPMVLQESSAPGLQSGGAIPGNGDQEREAEAGSTTQSLSPGGAILDLVRQLPAMDMRVGEDEEGLQLRGPVGVILFIGFLTLLPTLLLLMTGFTRILVVMHLLKQALGTQTAPPTHLLTAMALLLTGLIMAPTLSEVNRTALDPWLEGQVDEVQMIQAASGPFRQFMLSVTREEDLGTFLDMHGGERPTTVEEIPMVVVTSAFVTSELRHAFQIGFALFLPFVVIDIVVASILMSMGMFMLPPVMVSLPFKLLLFVLVDGWSLVIEGLVRSFG